MWFLLGDELILNDFIEIIQKIPLQEVIISDIWGSLRPEIDHEFDNTLTSLTEEEIFQGFFSPYRVIKYRLSLTKSQDLAALVRK